ncbi:type IV toxin-antitoxin system AbiEi family antitoxin [Burkholderia stagnalis]|uniref:type IV toxin-antitoxin system AbiEi family antitoxin n=1 Tax=Burkholderia stagnalis TaxID=1503054 RepID=UPI000F568BEC|nr:hypothetical protein [Burkholderia stagnalis]RQR11325.1 hypothetical protein DF025_17315 [Burkholderia stagnalis]RQR20352.1 hypothetical protein DF026_17120 [Burkholderia stagnalis]
MQVRKLITALDKWDNAGIWAFSSATLALIFREEPRAMLKALARHQKAGLIEHIARGLYVNPRARSLPPDVLSALVSFLRPWSFNYLSLESALSEAGWISQIPSRLTLMTTGRTQTFKTPYGTLEFVHTAQKEDQLQDELVFDSRRQLPVATVKRALRDLKRVGRNLDLVRNLESENATHSN